MKWFSLLWKLVAAFLVIIVVIIGLTFAYTSFAPIFGGKPDQYSQAKIEQSKHYNGEIFVNLEPTVVATPSDGSQSVVDTMIDLLMPAPDKNPQKLIPTKPIQPLDNGDFVWLGHSTVLFKMSGQTVVTDPIFYRASPVFFGGKPFAQDSEITADQLPALDIVLISHDHYDHLDDETIKEIDAKVGRYIVPLGIKAHIQRWGIASEKIVELDWYQSFPIGEITYTLTPSRHFSGRGLTNRFETLWGSWVVKNHRQTVYFSGDGGYSSEFKRIGEMFGPFDIAFLEDGAYNQDWSQIHMFPEQAVQAAVDLNAKVILPIHWGKYDLARHKWTEPVERLKQEAKIKQVNVTTPMIGERFTATQYPQTSWWNNVK